MSTVCYCGQPDCPVTTWEHDACVANLRAERDALKAQLAEATGDGTLSARIGAVREALGMSEFDSATEVSAVERLKAQIAEAENLHAHYVERIRELQEADAMTELREAVEVLRKVTEALEGSFPGDESVGWPEFPEVSMSQAWTRRVEARAFLAKVKP